MEQFAKQNGIQEMSKEQKSLREQAIALFKQKQSLQNFISDYEKSSKRNEKNQLKQFRELQTKQTEIKTLIDEKKQEIEGLLLLKLDFQEKKEKQLVKNASTSLLSQNNPDQGEDLTINSRKPLKQLVRTNVSVQESKRVLLTQSTGNTPRNRIDQKYVQQRQHQRNQSSQKSLQQSLLSPKSSRNLSQKPLRSGKLYQSEANKKAQEFNTSQQNQPLNIQLTNKTEQQKQEDDNRQDSKVLQQDQDKKSGNQSQTQSNGIKQQEQATQSAIYSKPMLRKKQNNVNSIENILQTSNNEAIKIPDTNENKTTQGTLQEQQQMKQVIQNEPIKQQKETQEVKNNQTEIQTQTPNIQQQSFSKPNLRMKRNLNNQNQEAQINKLQSEISNQSNQIQSNQQLNIYESQAKTQQQQDQIKQLYQEQKFQAGQQQQTKQEIQNQSNISQKQEMVFQNQQNQIQQQDTQIQTLDVGTSRRRKLVKNESDQNFLNNNFQANQQTQNNNLKETIINNPKIDYQKENEAVPQIQDLQQNVNKQQQFQNPSFLLNSKNKSSQNDIIIPQAETQAKINQNILQINQQEIQEKSKTQNNQNYNRLNSNFEEKSNNLSTNQQAQNSFQKESNRIQQPKYQNQFADKDLVKQKIFADVSIKIQVEDVEELEM